MQEQFLRYDERHVFIKNDLKRLKKLKSLPDDIQNQYRIIQGQIRETGWPPPFNFCNGLITRQEINGSAVYFYKDRFAIMNPRLTPSEGGRIIYGLFIKEKLFIPFLVYRANEEGCAYEVNRKRFHLKKCDLAKIIKEKINCLP